jgi:thiosulfate/3-mercaptopyruvate sulfurtransferase
MSAIVNSAPPQALLIDSRTPTEYAAGHLPGALNLDLSSTHMRLRTQAELKGLEDALADLNGKIGATPERLVVVYDSGLNNRLAKTAFVLALSGLQVSIWPQGWETQANSTSAVAPIPGQPWAKFNRDILLTADEVLHAPKLLDVREGHEYATGHIPGAQNVPLGKFLEPGGVAAMNLTPGEEVGVHCRSGARSATAFWVLLDQGYRAKNYLGSMLEWENERDLPVER